MATERKRSVAIWNKRGQVGSDLSPYCKATAPGRGNRHRYCGRDLRDLALVRGLCLVEHGDLAGELRAFLDLDLGVADLAGHLARAVDDELLPHGELALEPAMDLGVVDR